MLVKNGSTVNVLMNTNMLNNTTVKTQHVLNS